jgi:hypothetical protein
VTLVVALGALMVALGPAPAVTAGTLAIGIDARVSRVSPEGALVNLLVYALMGLVGGVAFDALRAEFGLERQDSAVALLVPPV